jgi:hypothetical protein
MGDEVLDAEENFVVSNEVEDDGNNDRKVGSDETNSMSDDTHHGDFGTILEEVHKQENLKSQKDKLNHQIKRHIRHDLGPEGNHVRNENYINANKRTDHHDRIWYQGGNQNKRKLPDILKRVVDENEVGLVEVLAEREVLFLEGDDDVLDGSLDFG